MGDLIDRQAALKEVREAYENDEMFDGLVRKYAAMQGLPIHVARNRLYNYLQMHVSSRGKHHPKGDDKKVLNLAKAITENTGPSIARSITLTEIGMFILSTSQYSR
jgi:hypothetical protein